MSAPTPMPAAMPQTAPTSPVTPASTTTERHTWRRVMPAARRTPISRTRSRTFIVRVLTMPRAATMTAMTASASNRLKTRSSASPMAPWMRPRLAGSRARARASSAKAVALGVVGGGIEADREGVGAGQPEAVGVGPADEPRLAGAAGQRAVGDADDGQGQRRAVGGGDVDGVAHGETVAGAATPAGTMVAPAGVERGEGGGPVAVDEAQAAVGGEVGADHRGGVGTDAGDGQVERGDGADARSRRARSPRVSTRPSSSGRGKIEVTTRSPGTTSATHALAAARACCPRPPRATMRARPTVRAPTVRVARARSRRIEARARRSSSRATSA